MEMRRFPPAAPCGIVGPRLRKKAPASALVVAAKGANAKPHENAGPLFFAKMGKKKRFPVDFMRTPWYSSIAFYFIDGNMTGL